MGQFAKLGVGLLGLFERVSDQRLGVLIILCPARKLEGDNGVHEPLLGGVVQIAYDAAAGVVVGRDETGPRGDELVARLGVRDRGGNELGEVRDSRLGVRRERRLRAS